MAMRIREIAGLTAGQKQSLVTNFGARREDSPPFEDDKPSHTISLQGKIERQAAMSGILASAHEHPELPLLRVGGVALAELRTKDQVALWPERRPDEALLAGMHWTAHYRDRVRSLTLSAIARHSELAADLAEFVGGESEFRSSLEVLQEEMRAIEKAGVFDETGPDHVHTITMPDPKAIAYFAMPNGGFHY